MALPAGPTAPLRTVNAGNFLFVIAFGGALLPPSAAALELVLDGGRGLGHIDRVGRRKGVLQALFERTLEPLPQLGVFVLLRLLVQILIVEHGSVVANTHE